VDCSRSWKDIDSSSTPTSAEGSSSSAKATGLAGGRGEGLRGPNRRGSTVCGMSREGAGRPLAGELEACREPDNECSLAVDARDIGRS